MQWRGGRHYAATLEEETNTWVMLAGLEAASPFRRYLAAMYWSVATLCGGGLPSLLGAPVPGTQPARPRPAALFLCGCLQLELTQRWTCCRTGHRLRRHVHRAPVGRLVRAVDTCGAGLCECGAPTGVDACAARRSDSCLGLWRWCRVVGNILSVIQSIDRQQQDVNTKKVSRLLAYVRTC